MAVRLRARRPSDDVSIDAIARAAFAEYSLDPDARIRGARTIVATLDEKLIGFASLRIRLPFAHLDAIAVGESARGRGVGRALLGAIEHAALLAGAERMQLVTAESNLAALDLFLKQGYRIVRTHRRFYERGQTAHVLEKPLAPAG